MLVLAALVIAGFAPGIVTAVQIYRLYGWPRAVLAGLGVTVALPGLLLLSLIMMPSLAIILASATAVAALAAFERGHIWTGAVWAVVMSICLWCAGWTG